MDSLGFFLFLAFVLFFSVYLRETVEGFLTEEEGYVADSPLNNILDKFVQINSELDRLIAKLENNQELTFGDSESLKGIPRLSAEEISALKGQLQKLDQLIDQYVSLMAKLETLQPQQIDEPPTPSNVRTCLQGCSKAVGPHPRCKETTIHDTTSGKCFMECPYKCTTPNLDSGHCYYNRDCQPCGFDKVDVLCPSTIRGPGTSTETSTTPLANL